MHEKSVSYSNSFLCGGFNFSIDNISGHVKKKSWEAHKLGGREVGMLGGVAPMVPENS
jgi:hypothetical protein